MSKSLKEGVTEDQKNMISQLIERFRLMNLHFNGEYNQSFPYIYNVADKIFIDSKNPNLDNLKKETHSFIQGMLVVYFFTMWDELQPDWTKYSEQKLKKFLEKEEVMQLGAYRHIRNCATHKTNGERAMRNTECVLAFEDFYDLNPGFSGIIWDKKEDTIDLSKSTIGGDVIDFMKNLSGKIPLRISSEIYQIKTIDLKNVK